jgi:Chromatin assembly factor 1 subunit A
VPANKKAPAINKEAAQTSSAAH